MVMANTLAIKLNLLSAEDALRIKALLERYELPTHYKIDSLETFYDAFFLDKKSANDKITFILAKGIGGNEMRSDVPKETVLKALGESHA